MATYRDVYLRDDGKACDGEVVFGRPARWIVRKPVYGVGLNDFPYSVQTGCGKNKQTWVPYVMWKEMLRRCYDDALHKDHPTYAGTACYPSWLTLSVFLEWLFQQPFIEKGWNIDKDLLSRESKVYSPETCVLVPVEINMFLTKRDASRNGLIGAHFRESSGRFLSSMTRDSKSVHLGCFSTDLEAHLAYKAAKEAYSKVLAEKYKDVLDIRAYEALLNYSVEITD